MSVRPAPGRPRPAQRQTQLIWALVIVAVALRIMVRYARGVPDPATGGYYFYLLIARTFAHGHGLCMLPGTGCAVRTPVYSLLVSMFLQHDMPGGALIVAQAAIGASVVWTTYLLGRVLFDDRVGMLAAVAATLSPYTIVHDTALQDTVPVNALAAAAVVLLLAEVRDRAAWKALGAGVALALLVLTSVRMALVVPFAIGWVAWAGHGALLERWRRAGLVALPVIVLVGGWIWRNDIVVGAPVLTTESGDHLWVANSASTMSRFPLESMDRSRDVAYEVMTPADAEALARVRGDAVATDRQLAAWGRHYIVTHPIDTMWHALIKIAIPIGTFYSPFRTILIQIGFTLVYLPIHVAALIAAWRMRRRWRDQVLVYGFVVAFLVTTAVYWAHTSHSTWLDPLWFVYAAAMLVGTPIRGDASATIPGTHATNSGYE